VAVANSSSRNRSISVFVFRLVGHLGLPDFGPTSLHVASVYVQARGDLRDRVAELEQVDYSFLGRVVGVLSDFF
jgi:hypothetical protein